MIRRAWCLLCYHIAFNWWAFRYRRGGLPFRLYCCLLPWAGEEAHRRGEL